MNAPAVLSVVVVGSVTQSMNALADMLRRCIFYVVGMRLPPAFSMYVPPVTFLEAGCLLLPPPSPVAFPRPINLSAD